MNNKLKIAVYAICKDEEQFVDKWMDSMLEADLVVVADTGSTDNTVEKLRARGALVYSIKINPWRFDLPRNIALNFVPGDFDVCVSTDLDEVFETGWRDKLENIWRDDTTRVNYMYTWKFNPDGTRATTFWRGKIHSRHGYRWVHPVHEVLYYYGTKPDKTVWERSIQLNHFPDETKSRSQYLSLLELSVKEDPDYLTNLFYLGREYSYYDKWDECIETLQIFLQKPEATWKDQRSAAMRFIARSYKAKGNLGEARAWLYKAIAEARHLREPYIEMAQLAHKEKDWPTVYNMVENALKIKEKKASYLTEGFAWNYTVYDLGALSCYYLGMLQKSYEFAKKAVEMDSGNQRLKDNLDRIKKSYEHSLE
ncbi:glycosyl transferase family 2 [Fredinandcohnia sp. 179-A 10B2 NHS]|uniref:tetratricopeptide repeat-containing glycosyltransferase n=1 Tax=Fredinandcohnia sp. 179-A 10B2 NHS TaxID=3235176 RepID=UPI0039A2E839